MLDEIMARVRAKAVKGSPCKKTDLLALCDAIKELRDEKASLWLALEDCMDYVDVDNLATQTKYQNWRAVLRGESWNPANVEVTR